MSIATQNATSSTSISATAGQTENAVFTPIITSPPDLIPTSFLDPFPSLFPTSFVISPPLPTITGTHFGQDPGRPGHEHGPGLSISSGQLSAPQSSPPTTSSTSISSSLQPQVTPALTPALMTPIIDTGVNAPSPSTEITTIPSSISPNISSPSSSPANATGSSSRSFFSNKSAVIGTFTTAGIILLGLISICLFRLQHKRKIRRQEKDLEKEHNEVIADFAERTLSSQKKNASNPRSRGIEEGVQSRQRINLDDPNSFVGPKGGIERSPTSGEKPIPPESWGYGYGYSNGYGNTYTSPRMDNYERSGNNGAGVGAYPSNLDRLGLGYPPLSSIGARPGIPHPSSSAFNSEIVSPYDHARLPNPYDHPTGVNDSNLSLSQSPMQATDTYAYGGISTEYDRHIGRQTYQ